MCFRWVLVILSVIIWSMELLGRGGMRNIKKEIVPTMLSLLFSGTAEFVIPSEANLEEVVIRQLTRALHFSQNKFSINWGIRQSWQTPYLLVLLSFFLSFFFRPFKQNVLMDYAQVIILLFIYQQLLKRELLIKSLLKVTTIKKNFTKKILVCFPLYLFFSHLFFVSIHHRWCVVQVISTFENTRLGRRWRSNKWTEGATNNKISNRTKFNVEVRPHHPPHHSSHPHIVFFTHFWCRYTSLVGVEERFNENKEASANIQIFVQRLLLFRCLDSICNYSIPTCYWRKVTLQRHATSLCSYIGRIYWREGYVPISFSFLLIPLQNIMKIILHKYDPLHFRPYRAFHLSEVAFLLFSNSLHWSNAVLIGD